MVSTKRGGRSRWYSEGGKSLKGKGVKAKKKGKSVERRTVSKREKERRERERANDLNSSVENALLDLGVLLPLSREKNVLDLERRGEDGRFSFGSSGRV